MLRLLLGIAKGGAIGAAVGFGADRAGLAPGGTLVYGSIGALVGLLVGRPIWSHLTDPESTLWTALLKTVFGFGVGAGLFALVHRVLGDPTIHAFGVSRPATSWAPAFGALVGLVYGAWVELDDPPKKPAAAKKA